jgi:hypothetical protein
MKERLTLHRGIAVPRESAEMVTDKIRLQGIKGDEGFWRIRVTPLRSIITGLLQKDGLSTADTRNVKLEYDTICACGDDLGASYYALRHNTYRNADEVSLVVDMDIPETNIFVDGRDFLYACFQLWDCISSDYYKQQCLTLAKLFGSEILQYFNRAASSRCQDFRIAMCDLACQDLNVIKVRARNTIIIGGRHQTVYSSAFSIRPPISADQILNVRQAKQYCFKPDIRLKDFETGNLDYFLESR